MKKVILMAAVAMLFVGTAAAQGKVTKTNSGANTTTTTTVAKPEQGPKANNNNGNTCTKMKCQGTDVNCNKNCSNHAKEGANCNKPCAGKKDAANTTVKAANGTSGKDHRVQR